MGDCNICGRGHSDTFHHISCNCIGLKRPPLFEREKEVQITWTGVSFLLFISISRVYICCNIIIYIFFCFELGWTVLGLVRPVGSRKMWCGLNVVVCSE